MTGYFDMNGNPRLDIRVMGIDKAVAVSALVDTGSQVPLMLSLEQAVAIGLKLVAVTPVELADGSIKKEFVFSGSILMDRQKILVDIMLTSGETLLGIPPLKNYQLTIDFARQKVNITKR